MDLWLWGTGAVEKASGTGGAGGAGILWISVMSLADEKIVRRWRQSLWVSLCFFLGDLGVFGGASTREREELQRTSDRVSEEGELAFADDVVRGDGVLEGSCRIDLAFAANALCGERGAIGTVSSPPVALDGNCPNDLAFWDINVRGDRDVAGTTSLSSVADFAEVSFMDRTDAIRTLARLTRLETLVGDLSFEGCLL